jgi:hypothetical protein
MHLHPVTFAASDLSNQSVDTDNAVIRGVSVCTAGLVARGHDLTVDSTTLKQMLAAAESKGQVPVKVDHKSGAASVCGFLENFRIEGQKLKADWHLLHTHPQTAQILEVAERMPSGVGLSASFLPPDKPEAGKARCGELLSVDYVTLPAANPTGLFSARVQDPATARRKAAFARVAKIVGAGALGAAGAAGLAARGVDRLAALKLTAFQPSAKVRAGIVGAAGALGAVHTARAVAQRRRRPDYANLNEMEADLAAAIRAFGRADAAPLARELAAAIQRDEAAQAQPVRTVVIHPARPSLKRRALIRAAKIGAGAAGGAYVGRRLGTAAGATTGALAGLLFQSHARAAVRVGITRAAKAQTI